MKARTASRRHDSNGRHWKVRALILFLALAAQKQLLAEQLPDLEVTALTGRVLRLPASLDGSASLLIIGFSSGSSNETGRWGDVLSRAYRSDSTLAIHPVAVLAAVPGLIRPLVIDGIRAGVAKSIRKSFFIVTNEERRWKALVRFSGKDNAYLIFVGPAGKILWRWTGPPTQAALRSLARAIAAAPGDRRRSP